MPVRRRAWVTASLYEGGPVIAQGSRRSGRTHASRDRRLRLKLLDLLLKPRDLLLSEGKLGLSLDTLGYELIPAGPQPGHLRPGLIPLGPELVLTSLQFGHMLGQLLLGFRR